MSSIILRTLVRHLRSSHLKMYQLPRRYNYFSIHLQNILYAPHTKFSTSLSVDVDQPQSFKKSKNTYKVKPIRSFDEIFQDMSSYYLHNGYVKSEIFSKVIDSLSSVNLTQEQSNFLLESINYLYTLTSAERMKYFEKLWNYLKNNNNINQEKILTALKIFQKNKISLNEARAFLDEFEDDFKMHLNSYEELVCLTCETGDIDSATKEILEEMRQKELPLTNKVFNSLILGYSRNMNIKNCEEVLDTMNAANVTPASDTYCELARAYIENGLLEKAEAWLDKSSDQISINEILMLLKSSALVNSKSLTEKLINKLPEELRNVTELSGIIRGICVELLYSKKIDEAFLILDSFPTPIFKENQSIDSYGHFFIIEMIKSDLYSNEKCIEICEKLNNKNERAIHTACEMILNKYPQNGEFFLKRLSNSEKLRPHYFWPLFNYNFKKKGESGIFYTLKLMSDLKCECDYDTFYHKCLPRLSIVFQNIEMALKNFEKSGLKPSTFLPPLISILLNQQKRYDITKISQMYPTKINTTKLVQPLLNFKINKKYQSYVKLLKVLVEKSENKNFDLAGHILIELFSRYKNINELTELLNQFEIQEIKISKSAAELLRSQLNELDKSESTNKILTNLKQIIHNELNLNMAELPDAHISHPKDMSLQELECHLFELEEKKLNTRGILRRLLQLYVRESQLEKALETKAKCDQLNVHNSPGMLGSILDLYIKLKNLNEAQKTLQDIERKYPGFLIDEHKIIDLATLLVENDKLEEAQTLILDRTSKNRTIGGEHIYKNLWKLLTQVAHYSARMHPDDDNNLTKEFFSMLRKYKFCNPVNVLLGPIIREYLLKNKIKEAVYEFKYIADNFKRTPLQLELMSLLMRISNGKEEQTDNLINISQEEAQTYLQELVTSTSDVHGAVNCNGTLLLAIAESGDENQLRKLLINPEFHINIEAMSKSIEHLNSNGRIENILKLAKASRGIRQVFNEQELYKMLLNEFVKRNDYENAIELYNKLEADDELKISTEFAKNLVDLLKFNNVDIPGNIALTAQLKI